MEKFWFNSNLTRDFKYMIKQKGFKLLELGEAIEKGHQYMSHLVTQRTSITGSEIAKLSQLLDVPAGSLDKYFLTKNGSKMNKQHEPLKDFNEELPKKIETPVEAPKRIANGYAYNFTVGGNTHTAYGRSELEAKQNAEARAKEIADREKGLVSIKMSKDDVTLICEQLFKDIREDNVQARESIRSIALRLVTQLI